MEFQSKTRDGRPVHIFTQDSKVRVDGVLHPIVGEVLSNGKWRLLVWTKEGRHVHFNKDPYPLDLIPLHKFEVDDKVLVRNHESHLWKRRYFASYADGMYYTFNDGATSYTGSGTTSWNKCIPYDPSITNVA